MRRAIVPEIPGRVAEVKVGYSASVKLGDVLFVIDSAKQKAALDKLKKENRPLEVLQLARLAKCTTGVIGGLVKKGLVRKFSERIETEAAAPGHDADNDEAENIHHPAYVAGRARRSRHRGGGAPKFDRAGADGAGNGPE